MAGKVEGAMMLDAEYHCRRCDGRTDMIPHVSKIMQTCKTMDSHDEILKLLNLGSALLRGSEKPAAKDLLDRVELTISKVFLHDVLLIQIKSILHVLKVHDQFEGLFASG